MNRKKWRRALALILSAVMLLSMTAFAAEDTGDVPDYADRESWAYFELGEDTGIDIFLICPVVDTRSERNAFDLNEKLKSRFVNALDMEKGIYEETGRLFSPYYRQMSLNAYKLPEEERQQARKIACGDVFAAFQWYLEHENGGRGLILAGFSQGAEMCLELMKEYFGGDSAQACALRDKLIAVYAIGWSFTEETTAAYPQIIPAKGETDTGVVISFDCEDGSLTDTLVNPAGKKALSINPLNWKTDGTPADKSFNTGAVMSTGAEPIPALCGAYIGERGELVVTDVSAADYPPGIDIFPEGSYHIYDYMFFFTNLKENVAARAKVWRKARTASFSDVENGAWYAGAVRYAFENGLMLGTGKNTFSPGRELSRAQLVTILWRAAGEPAADAQIPYADIEDGKWYSEAVRWAAAEKIIDREGSFGPEDAVLRNEAIYLL